MSDASFECRDCGCRFDLPEGVPRLEQVCPDCSSTRWGVIRQSSHNVIMDGHSWSTENNGKGRRISQLDTGIGKPFFAKSQQHALDEASRRGLNAIKA